MGLRRRRGSILLTPAMVRDRRAFNRLPSMRMRFRGWMRATGLGGLPCLGPRLDGGAGMRSRRRYAASRPGFRLPVSSARTSAGAQRIGRARLRSKLTRGASFLRGWAALRPSARPRAERLNAGVAGLASFRLIQDDQLRRRIERRWPPRPSLRGGCGARTSAASVVLDRGICVQAARLHDQVPYGQLE